MPIPQARSELAEEEQCSKVALRTEGTQAAGKCVMASQRLRVPRELSERAGQRATVKCSQDKNSG